MSLRLRLLNLGLRRIEKPILARIADPGVARDRFERQGRRFRHPPFALYQPDQLDAVPVLWASIRPRWVGVILYFHGGGYVIGSPATHAAMLARLSALTGIRTCLPDYRLAPQHPWPAAIEDAEQVWRGLLNRGYRGHDIVLGGDSAGGGLMLNLLSRICQSGGEIPAGAFAFSPWTDLTLSGASVTENAETEALLPVQKFAETRDYFLAGADQLEASALFADYPNCPPVLLQASNSEILRDDTLRMAEKLTATGTDVTLDMWDNTPHVWPLFQGWLPEADAALNRVADFVTQRVPAPPRSES